MENGAGNLIRIEVYDGIVDIAVDLVIGVSGCASGVEYRPTRTEKDTPGLSSNVKV